MSLYNKHITLELHSKKRLIYNCIVYSSYAIIFTISYMTSVLIAERFGTLQFLNSFPLFKTLLLITIIKFFVFNFFNFKRFALYSSDIYDIIKTFLMVIVSSLIIISLSFYLVLLDRVPVLVVVLDSAFSFSAIIFYNALFRFLYTNRKNTKSIFKHSNVKKDIKKTLIIGDNGTAQILCKSLKDSKYDVKGFVTDDPRKINMQISGKKIYGPIDNLLCFTKNNDIKQLIIASQNGSTVGTKRIVELIKDTDISISAVPAYTDIVNGHVKIDSIRDIKIEELLQRDKIQIDKNMIFDEISDKTVLVTGAAGSIGSEICRAILKFNPKALIALDQAETPLFYLNKELRYELSLGGKKTTFIPIIADIVNSNRLYSVFEDYQPDIILHAAAYKHVPLMEGNYVESITNNVLGTKTLGDLADAFKTELFIMISTDKAVNPTSTMGLTKRIAEIYIQSLNTISHTRYETVRFGNVLDSQGNVVEIFKKQIADGGPVTVTHPEMKRYFMLTSEAVQLVLQAGMTGKGGEIFMLDMGESIYIVDLAKSMIKISGYEVEKDIKIVYTGIRPGEKLFEELQYADEKYSVTKHKKIFVRKCRKNNWQHSKSQIEALIHSVYDVETVKNIIYNLVPEYNTTSNELLVE